MGPTDDVESLRFMLQHPAAVLLLATTSDGIIGTLLGTFDGWRGHVYRLVVHPTRRRQGIGRTLVREMEQVFIHWGVRRIIALVEVDRPWAMQSWADVGYRRDDHDLVHVG